MWDLIEARGRVPVAGGRGQVPGGLESFIDMDGTLITAHSDKENAAPTWKKGYGSTRWRTWCLNTRECLAMLLRSGNARSNTFTDHKEVLTGRCGRSPGTGARSWSGSTAPEPATT